MCNFTKQDHDEADGDEPGGHEPGDGELLAHDAGVAVHGEGLEPLDGHPEHGEEARHDGDNEQTVDQGVLEVAEN